MNTTHRQAHSFYIVLFSLLLLFTQTVWAFGLLNMQGPVKLQPRYKYGAVYTRAIVPGESGAPVYVEYDSKGNVVSEIGEALGDLADLRVMAAVNYNAYVGDYQQLQSDFSDMRLLNKSEYQSQDFVTIDGKTVNKKQLNEYTLYVAVVADAQIVNESGDFLVLREFPINPTVALNEQTVSLLVTEQGEIVKQSEYNIAFRVGFFGDKSVTDDSAASVFGRQHDDQIYGPIKHTAVSVNQVFTGGVTTTDDEGKYVLNYFIPPCPGFSIWHKTDVQLQLSYARFNPRGTFNHHYFLTRPDSDFCAQYSAYSALVLDIEAAISQPVKMAVDFPVDLMVLYGQATMANYGTGKIPLATNTKYNHESKSLYRMARHSADFDGDGIADLAVLGDKVEITSNEGEISEQFIPSAIGRVQGIWLSSNMDNSIKPFIENAVVAQNALWQAHEQTGDITEAASAIASLDPIPAVPDFTRLADWSDDFKDRALLSQISDDDLGDTDIYIFRESTGMLIAEQKGVASSYRGNANSVDNDNAVFHYSMKLRGASDDIFDVLDSGNKFSNWQAEGGLNPDLHQRRADHLKQGERVKIVAINRKTGYIGTQLAALNINVGAISISADPIFMYPPNLQIWAERVQGEGYKLTQTEKDELLIGNEGAATNDDSRIVIYSEWLDQDGFALPAQLSDYGYTGRIAKIGGANKVTDLNTSSVSHFAIPPGRKTQVIQLPEADLSNNHIYIQVNGEPSNRNPVFEPGSATGHEGILKYRPEYFVPFKVPVWDENSNNLQIQAYQQAKESNSSLSKPKPFYQWLYRSELQFSLYDLNLQEIRVTDAENATEDIINVNNPVISSSDQLIEFIYDIATDGAGQNDSFNPLEAWSYNGDKELIFEIGGQEVTVVVDGLTHTVKIDNIQLLSSFTPEQLLTLRLYSNNDAGNILWEGLGMRIEAAVDNNSDGLINMLDSNPGTAKDDQTSPENPFRFWVNNDFDIVSTHTGGLFDYNKVRCAPRVEPEPGEQDEQICEQWDLDFEENQSHAYNSNTAALGMNKIESERDLEDFIPLYIRLSSLDSSQSKFTLPEGITFSMRANNININLFKGAWQKGTDYLTDQTVMQNQVKRVLDVNNDGDYQQLYQFQLGDKLPDALVEQQQITLSTTQMSALFAKTGDARLIVESYKASPDICITEPKQCYLELTFKDKGKVISSEKIFMAFFDVKNFYEHHTVGKGQLTDISATPLSVNIEDGFQYTPIFSENDSIAQEQKNEYIMMVHGWRMQYAERVSFGETAFKRLYWSGYRGRFGLFSWPTGWFDKPAHAYGVAQLPYLLGNEQNYGDSEMKAREVGPVLANHLATLKSNFSYNINIFAHSMGNVVVSEALRNAKGQKLVEHYVASQAAEVAGSYSQSAPLMNHKIQLNQLGLCEDKLGYGEVETVWRCYNLPIITRTDYDMPPNHYAYTIPEQHGPTSPALEKATAEQEQWGANYYFNIADAITAGGVTNFYNAEDAALEGWEFNQLTKPDTDEGGPDTSLIYDYGFNCAEDFKNCILRGYPLAEYNDLVVDSYTSGITVYPLLNSNLIWKSPTLSETDPETGEIKITPITITPESADILGHIIPARTHALGQGPLVVKDKDPTSVVNKNKGFAYGDSNQGHSAQFYDSFFERQNYWEKLLFAFGFLKEIKNEE